MEVDAISGTNSAVDYDVFLSFIGKDTRKGFVDQLYYHLSHAGILGLSGADTRDASVGQLYHHLSEAGNGIRIFRDAETLERGQSIEGQIRLAISSSKILIPIFSKNYASSKWCLNELATMVKYRESEKEKVIMPIFYDVSPSDVRLKTNLYTRQLHKLGRYGSEVLSEWEHALVTAGSIKGWHLRYQDYGEFWRSITEEILRWLIKAKRDDGLRPLMPAAEYEVYLSSTGEDTHHGLFHRLYRGMQDASIRIFRCEKECDDHQWENFLRTCKIFIPVFSGAYASSAQCLKELKLAAEHWIKHRTMEILPVFDDVKTTDVKLETGTYLNALVDQAAKFGAETVHQWMNALRQVASIKLGRQMVDGSPDKFCKSIVEEVSRKLITTYADVDVPAHFVGMPNEFELAKRKLNLQSVDVRFLVIHGKGGTGKTTLAELLFNRLSYNFEGCIFLANVRESSERYGIEYLQNHICKSIANTGETENDGTVTIRERCRDKRVLIVLDDVDSSEQMKKLAGKTRWFGIGSRIIVTTRDKRVVPVPEHPKELDLQEMKIMDREPGLRLQLLCQHAFRQGTLPNDYSNVSDKLISAIQCVPLEIEIVGSFLHEKSKEVWQDVVAKFHEVPGNEVLGNLRIIYDEALNEAQRDIFLDIACFFANMEITNAVYMWEACNLKLNQELEFLTSMSFVKKVNNKLWMHDMIRELGRKIVLEEKVLGNRSRLWIYEEASEMLNRKKGADKVKALRLRNDDFWRKCTFGSEAFPKLQSLRFLELSGVNLDGNFENLLPMLRWLSWHDCPSDFRATNLCLKNLVILDLSRSQIDENWVGWNEIQMLNNLKVLNLTGCKNLTTTPDLSRYPMLERLILEGCERLTTIHNSIGTLKHLQHLNLKGCFSLTELSEEFYSLTALTEILANDCSFQLPQSLDNLSSLSIGGLTRLERLSLAGCNMITAFPDTLGELRSLSELDISATGITELPSSKNLVELRILKMDSTSIQKLPSSIGCMKRLEELYARKSKLQEIPPEIGQLCSLKIMDLSCTDIQQLPPTVGMLSLLQTLSLDSCHNLRSLPELPKSLTRLLIRSQSLGCIPDLSELSNLNDLVLCVAPDDNPPSSLHSSSLSWIMTLSKMVNLELCLSNVTTLPPNFATLSHLKSVHLACPDLHDCPNLPCSLQNLALAHIREDTKLPDLVNLKRLSSLKIDNCTIKDGLFGSFNIRELKFLEKLSVCKGNFIKLSGPDLPPSLKSLFVAECDSLTTLSNLSGLTNLEHLELSDCKNLVEISGLPGVKSLRELIIHKCSSLESLGDLANMGKLKVVQLDSCEKLHYVEGLDKLESVKYMRIYA